MISCVKRCPDSKIWLTAPCLVSYEILLASVECLWCLRMNLLVDLLWYVPTLWIGLGVETQICHMVHTKECPSMPSKTMVTSGAHYIHDDTLPPSFPDVPSINAQQFHCTRERREHGQGEAHSKVTHCPTVFISKYCTCSGLIDTRERPRDVLV